MALLLSLLAALVMLSYGPGGSLGCVLPLDHDQLSRENFMLLDQVNSISPALCLEDRKNFSFPQETVDRSQAQEAQAASVLYEMLQQTSGLFLSAHSPAAWNATLLAQLRSGLHRQLEDLHSCVGEAASALGKQDPTLPLKRYFFRIRLYLRQKRYSDCAWEVVRVEVRSSLFSSAKLQERLSRKDGDLGSPRSDPH